MPSHHQQIMQKIIKNKIKNAQIQSTNIPITTIETTTTTEITKPIMNDNKIINNDYLIIEKKILDLLADN